MILLSFHKNEILKNHIFPEYARTVVKLAPAYPQNLSFLIKSTSQKPTQNPSITLKTTVSNFL